jgi:inhibitor of cysteine peptidase
MNKFFVLLASVLLVLTSMTACQPKTRTYSEADNGQSIDLVVGQEILVKLEGNPTTGYTWELDQEASSGMEQVGEPDYKAGSFAIGSGGQYKFRFKAVETGQQTLHLKYWRIFEPDTPPIETFGLKINISEK